MSEPLESGGPTLGAATDPIVPRQPRLRTRLAHAVSDGRSRLLLFFGGAAALMVGLGAAYAAFGTNSAPPSSLAPVADMRSVPGGAQQANSPAYQAAMTQDNQDRADRAQVTGRSAVATVGVASRVDSASALEVKPEVSPYQSTLRQSEPRQAQAQTSAPVRSMQQHEPAPVQQPGNDQLAAAMKAQAAALLDGWKLKPSLVVSNQNERGQGGQTLQGSIGGNAAGQAVPPNAQAMSQAAGQAGSSTGQGGQILIPAGSIVYARLITGARSDVSSPVLAELEAGPLKGARMIGSFEQKDAVDVLVLQFSTITLKDGRSYKTSAFAVDPATARSGLASDVDRHYGRYALALAGSFVAGFADLAANSGKTVVVSPLGGSTSTYGTASTKTAIAAGIGEVGKTIAGDIKADARSLKPTVTIDPGLELGMIFVEPVKLEEKK